MTAGTREADTAGRMLEDVRWHWGSVFDIQFRDGLCRARWRDGRSKAELTAETPGELRQQIRDEYARLTRIRALR